MNRSRMGILAGVAILPLLWAGCGSEFQTPKKQATQYQRFVSLPAGSTLPIWSWGSGYYALDTKTGQLCHTVAGLSKQASAMQEPVMPDCLDLYTRYPD